ncbi:hypothetical protein K435DRAFT_959075 [Dendrothele bispora CBS 962.96]|uniref:PUB domain-containing protein n=1 Tax=Dendrothele bispora (strain CBS 962.96) TaxID=1314807 RepID=A0A4S8MYI7_DENBC|nr:hypothetical protein K435DRAFT_959075 [Dendrothele bispora CBS 962.96]
MATISPESLAAAAERRNQQTSEGLTHAQQLALHEKKTKFRRLIDPGIMRPNPELQAMKSLETLLKLCDNLIREPDNSKYQRFKTTNNFIQENIIKPKGTVEYARELGFRPEVEDFQPYYTFNPTRMEDLKIGHAILKDFIDLQKQKKERAAIPTMTQKQVAQETAEKVKLAFMEDRRTKQERDDREKELRAIRAAQGGAAATTTPTESNQSRNRTQRRRRHSDDDEEDIRQLPGTGRVLGDDGPAEPIAGEPPSPPSQVHSSDDEDVSMPGTGRTLVDVSSTEHPPPYEDQ